MQTVTIVDEVGRPFDAKVEVEGNVIIVHSRSGGGTDARNPDYRPAVEHILIRLAVVEAEPAIYLDSQRVQHLPLAERHLNEHRLVGSASERFHSLVRAMNAGSSSNGAYRRLRFEVPGLAGQHLTRIISGAPANTLPYERLPHDLLRRVTPHHVHRAVERFLRGDPHKFAESREYDLVTETGERLPPKAVFALALEDALEARIFPTHFTGGLGTVCFSILEAAGYAVVSKDDAATVPPSGASDSESEIEAALDAVPVTSEERSWIEGNLKIAFHMRRERAPGLAKAKKAAFIAEHGKLFCQRCMMEPVINYGPIGEACIEVHHAKVQLAEMDQGVETKLDDLECLCANCHRVLHRELTLGVAGAA